MISLSLPLGYYIFNLIAYLNRTWTGIHIWVGVVTALILPMYFLIPESVRWLAQNGKEDEAMDALLRIAKINGKNLSTDDKTKVDTGFFYIHFIFLQIIILSHCPKEPGKVI